MGEDTRPQRSVTWKGGAWEPQLQRLAHPPCLRKAPDTGPPSVLGLSYVHEGPRLWSVRTRVHRLRRLKLRGGTQAERPCPSAAGRLMMAGHGGACPWPKPNGAGRGSGGRQRSPAAPRRPEVRLAGARAIAAHVVALAGEAGKRGRGKVRCCGAQGRPRARRGCDDEVLVTTRCYRGGEEPEDPTPGATAPSPKDPTRRHEQQGGRTNPHQEAGTPTPRHAGTPRTPPKERAHAPAHTHPHRGTGYAAHHTPQRPLGEPSGTNV